MILPLIGTILIVELSKHLSKLVKMRLLMVVVFIIISSGNQFMKNEWEFHLLDLLLIMISQLVRVINGELVKIGMN
jgi:hypothetical protein